MQILVVDDQKRTRQSLRLLLNTLPLVAEIREAENGKEALERIEEKTPDLVVMDSRMPEMDGVQATRVIKQNRPQIKVILLSMYPDYREPGLQAGADAFVSKGQPPEVLLEKIDEVLREN